MAPRLQVLLLRLTTIANDHVIFKLDNQPHHNSNKLCYCWVEIYQVLFFLLNSLCLPPSSTNKSSCRLATFTPPTNFSITYHHNQPPNTPPLCSQIPESQRRPSRASLIWLPSITKPKSTHKCTRSPRRCSSSTCRLQSRHTTSLRYAIASLRSRSAS